MAKIPPMIAELLKQAGVDVDDPDVDLRVVGPGGAGMAELEELLKGGARPVVLESSVADRSDMTLDKEQLDYFRSSMNRLRDITNRGESDDGAPELYRQRIVEMIATLDYQISQDRDLGSHVAALTAVLGATLATMKYMRGLSSVDFMERMLPLMSGVVTRADTIKMPRYEGAPVKFWPEKEGERE